MGKFRVLYCKVKLKEGLKTILYGSDDENGIRLKKKKKKTKVYAYSISKGRL